MDKYHDLSKGSTSALQRYITILPPNKSPTSGPSFWFSGWPQPLTISTTVDRQWLKLCTSWEVKVGTCLKKHGNKACQLHLVTFGLDWHLHQKPATIHFAWPVPRNGVCSSATPLRKLSFRHLAACCGFLKHNFMAGIPQTMKIFVTNLLLDFKPEKFKAHILDRNAYFCRYLGPFQYGKLFAQVQKCWFHRCSSSNSASFHDSSSCSKSLLISKVSILPPKKSAHNGPHSHPPTSLPPSFSTFTATAFPTSMATVIRTPEWSVTDTRRRPWRPSSARLPLTSCLPSKLVLGDSAHEANEGSGWVLWAKGEGILEEELYNIYIYIMVEWGILRNPC